MTAPFAGREWRQPVNCLAVTCFIGTCKLATLICFASNACLCSHFVSLYVILSNVYIQPQCVLIPQLFQCSSEVRSFVSSACLRSWLEQDTSCPTCRMNLSDPSERTTQAPATGDINGNEPRPDAQNNDLQNQMTNHFFHFDGQSIHAYLYDRIRICTHAHKYPTVYLDMKCLSTKRFISNLCVLR